MIHLIEEIKNHENCSLFEAVRLSLNEVIGAMLIVVMEKGNRNEFARKGSPLVIGVGKEEYFYWLLMHPIIEYTRNVVYLEDGEIVRVNRKEELEIKTISNIRKNPYIHELEMSLDSIEKGDILTLC